MFQYYCREQRIRQVILGANTPFFRIPFSFALQAFPGTGQYLWKHGTGKLEVAGAKIYPCPVDIRDHQKFMGSQAGLRTIILVFEKERQKLFLKIKMWGLVLFSLRITSTSPYQKGRQQLILLVKFWRESLFADNSETKQYMPLWKNENKLLEITWDPYKILLLSGNSVYFGPFKSGMGRGARSFFEGLYMGTNTFFEVSNIGARTFFEVERVGSRVWPVK